MMQRLFVLGALFSSFAFSDEIRLTNGEWAPFLGEDLKQYGATSHLVTQAFLRLGHKTKFEFLPWPRALEAAKRPQIHGTLAWTITKERAESFYASTPVIITQVVFFHLKDKVFDWKDYPDLKQQRIGIMNGYDNGKAFALARKKYQLETDTTTTELQNLTKLLRKRIDIALVGKTVGLELIRKNFTEMEQQQFTYHPKPTMEKELRILFNKNIAGNALLVTQFNQAFLALKAEGIVDDVYNKMNQGEYNPPQ